MRYGIAVWNFMEPGMRLTDLVAELADAGFDAVSFSTGQFPNVDPAEWREIGALLRERGLAATLHGNFLPSPEAMAAVVDHLAESLDCVTFDAAMATDSRGTLYDWPAMNPMLERVARAAAERDFRFGLEDFPLDAAALDAYRDTVASVVHESPRWGMLVDIGHLNLRRTQHPYFAARSAADYVRGTPLPIVEVHVHDNDGTRDQHAPMGRGTTPFPEVAAALREVGFDGVSTIEIAPGFHDATPAEDRPHAIESLNTWKALLEPVD